MMVKALVILLSFFIVIPIVHFADFASANPFYVHERIFTEVPAPEGTEAPKITIQEPENNTVYASGNITLAFDASIQNTKGIYGDCYGIVKIYYKASWKPNETIITDGDLITRYTLPTNLSDIPDGNQSVTVNVVGEWYYFTGYGEINDPSSRDFYYDIFYKTAFSTVNFKVDTIPPIISVLSPQNKTFDKPDVGLNFTVNEKTSEIVYCLDGKKNETVPENLTLAGLAEGPHNLTLYATDMVGNVGISQTAYFNVNSLKPPPPFSVIPVAAVSIVAAVACAGIILYVKKRKG